MSKIDSSILHQWGDEKVLEGAPGWLAHSVEHGTLDHRVVGSRPMMGGEIT